ncbi:hypothetical protein SUGI_0131190 [Cryptomeria japonica]|uniref:uncharacterized protein LOC131048670 n=1 Tax=Cryptomeria japonica TaxID=3369 RepID=UPI0024089B14|nr:uncharacterized protein LOC131048670 [Cryptomeria japonica]GLJ10588.1 hypothetical protein SUGI_0131190 [Cryptomeria japonica]
MEWKKGYLDLILVPLALMCGLVYHFLLWYRVKNHPLQTTIGVNSIGRRIWMQSMIKNNERNNIIAVQTLRNSIMGSTLMATTCILLCSGLAAMISSTYSVKKPLNDKTYGAHGELMVSLKYVTILVVFIFSFFCHSLSIRFLNQVTYLVNTIQWQSPVVTADYVSELFERGFIFNNIGNRLFYLGFPLLLWTFGPILVFVSSVAILPVLYHLDYIFVSKVTTKDVGDQPENHEHLNIL